MSRLDCWCLDSPQQGTIQNLMSEVRESVRRSTTQLVLDSCEDNYYSLNLNLGERQSSSDLQLHNNIVKFVLKNFKSVTVHLVGQVYKVEYKTSDQILIFKSEYNSSSREHNGRARLEGILLVSSQIQYNNVLDKY